MNRRPSQSRTGFDSFSPQHTAHFKAAQPGGEFFEPKPRASLGRRLLLALLLMTLIALAVNLAVNQFVRVARVTVPIRRMDSAFEGYTLLQISDLKGATYGSNQALIRFALQNEDFLAIVSTKTIRIGERCFSNHNKLLWTLDGALGVKTGYTKAAGRVLVSAVERGGRRLIAVTVRDGNDWQDHRALYDFGFSFYKPREIVGRGECVGTLTAMDGSSADLRADSALEYAAADGETPQIQILYPKLAFSVGAAGSYAGWACVYMGTRCIGKLRLVWGGVNREAAG